MCECAGRFRLCVCVCVLRDEVFGQRCIKNVLTKIIHQANRERGQNINVKLIQFILVRDTKNESKSVSVH